MELYCESVRHYEVDDKSNIATIDYVKISNSFGYIIYGRDRQNIFRAIDKSNSFYTTANEAEIALEEAIKIYENDGNMKYDIGEENTPVMDIFKPVVSSKDRHDYFDMLLSCELRYPAKRMIQEISYSFVDKDNNLVQEFQGQGFNNRLWEIFLYVLFKKMKFEIDFTNASPDFSLSKYGNPIFVEAVTVGENPNHDINATSPMDVINLSKDYMPAKFGSSLYSKMAKRYWELPHVEGHPFILAIHDYHGRAVGPDTPGSMTWSRAGLENYLYGIREDITKDGELAVPRMIDGKNRPEVAFQNIEHHRKYNGKLIPSRFFEQPDTENVSAVLFSNGATVSTFNRMGKLAGFSGKNIYMIRTGIRFNTETSTVECFNINIDSEDYDESWGETVTMFHNPRAKHPIPWHMFEDISHLIFDSENNQFYSIYTPVHIFSSFTKIIGTKS